MSDLPAGWEWSTLGALCDLVRGVSFKKSESSTSAFHGSLPIIRAGNLSDAGIDFDNDLVWVPAERVSVDQRLRAGDIVVATSSGSIKVVGKSVHVGADWNGAHGAFMSVLRPVADIDPRFAGWFVRSPTVRSSWSSLAKGTNINNLKKGHLQDTSIPVPPLPEQRRIVDAIEEHFSRLDAAEAEVQRALQRLGSFWDAALDSALRDDWGRTALDDVNNDDRPICYGILKPKTEGALTIPYVEVRSISGGRINVDGLHRTTSEMHQQFIRSELRESDVVLAIRGSFDRAAVVPAELTGANVSRDVARIAPKESLLPAFLALFLESREAMSFFRERARGVAVQGINIGDLRQLPVPVPSLGEQDETIRFMAGVSEHRDTIRAELDRAAKRASSLRRAILAAAFSGRLVAQDPSDEPASALLERIAAERVALRPSRRKKAAS